MRLRVFLAASAFAILAFAHAQANQDKLQACGDHLPYGAPVASDAARLAPLCHRGYAAAVDEQMKIPRWVAYRLTAEHSIGCLRRTDDFHQDDALPANGQADPADYRSSGYDRGHQAPADDFAWDPVEMSDSFSMANMAPQLPGLNREGWERLEEMVRGWAYARGDVIVYVGPFVNRTAPRIGRSAVMVPVGFWKVVIDPRRREAIGYAMPQASVRKQDAARYEMPIAEIERLSMVSLPLPPGVDPTKSPEPWLDASFAWRGAKAKACGSSR